MPSTEGVIVKKVLPLIYVIDTSGSMFGDRIASVNEAIHELEPILREKVGEIPEAEIKIAALTFSSGARWITANGLVSLDDFFWNDATAGGLTDLGAALKELNQKLSEKRAKAVVDHLKKKGIEGDRLRAIGYGSEMPIADNETKEGREQNRRVELVPFEK